ncbi:hypothetical protein DFP72DRAFT_1167409 [Ephemerocybe angulata]|uniref:F-box domain-containing protein n=1 Tax=Ephemerocybe angulata TaxID=980116 RepID=A0A8H6M894_9AGAR|nr:hypothetical protein DFP72DRAFT_1167409 [Tulosesus angulatus]
MESSETVIEETDQIDMDGRASLPEPSTVEARDGSSARPFESMPNEIIGSILEEAHNQYYRSLPPRASWSPSSSSYRIEDVSSQVCSLWGGLAQHLPRLWSKFYLSRTNTGSIPKGEYDRLNLYLTRSVDEDLEIVFDSSGLNEKEPVLMLMLDLIPPHLRRLRRFVLHSDGTNFVLPFYKSLTGVSAPRLEHFDVSTGEDPNYMAAGFHHVHEGWDPRILTEGPLSIKYLRLDSSSGVKFRPPFDHLVHFSLHRGVACMELFLSWVCLEQVFSLPFIETISICGPVIDPWDPSPPLRCIDAKRLKHFRIGNCTDLTLLSYLFSCVSAPLLESITLAATPNFAYNVLAPPSGVSGSPFPSLKSLYLVDVLLDSSRLSWGDFRYLALKTASITHLSISYTSTMPRRRRRDIVHFLESRFAEAPWPNVERADFNLTKAVEYPTSEELAWSSSRAWGKLSCVRFPSHSLPTNTPSGLAIESLTQVLPDWPPNYDFASPVFTNEFCVPVVPASSSP